MKLTKILLEYPGAFTPRPKDEWERNKEQIEKREYEEEKRRLEDTEGIINRYLENGGEGDLILRGVGIDIPSKLTRVKGDLHIGSHYRSSYPTKFEGSSLTVDGTFSLSLLRRLRELPNFLVVHEDLVVFGCDYLEKLPDYMFIGRNCFFDETTFQYDFEIEGDITIMGDLYLSDNDVWDKYSNAQIKDKMKVVGEIHDY